MAYRYLNSWEIQQLSQQGCFSEDWQRVRFDEECDLTRFRNVHFSGTVTVGKNRGMIEVERISKPCGLFHAHIHDCEIGDNVRIASIGTVVSNYVIESNVLIENVSALVADPDADFGNGIELEPVNEGGGRSVVMFSDLTAQTAYLQAMLKHDPDFTAKLRALIEAHIAPLRTGRGRIASGARILHCGEIRNVNIGPAAFLHRVARLDNGTVNSCVEHPTEVGPGVHAESFILSEGATVDSAAIIDKVFVGQGTKIGKQFSAENSLFFANCEGFHGEAVAVFGGPFTVTHHKSTLLIAGLFSFYNAGSGTNQSNHMYKLGPLHQGVLERGCKTGSSSYLLHETHLGAFSVVLGKHLVNINVPDLPFSYIYTEGDESKMIPAINIFSIGTVRDGEKWPQRDRRRANQRRDLIIFDVFSPYTVEKMRAGRDLLLTLHDQTPKEKLFINHGGVQIKRLMLRKGAKFYDMAIRRYLNGKVWERLAVALASCNDWSEAVNLLATKSDLKTPHLWTDLAGLLTPRERVRALIDAVKRGAISSYNEVLAELQKMFDHYRDDEWAYVSYLCAQEHGCPPMELTPELAGSLLEEWHEVSTSLHAMIIEDAKKEFGAQSRIGYGLDLTEEEALADFEAVRGTIETNSVIQKLNAEREALDKRYAEWQALLGKYTK